MAVDPVYILSCQRDLYYNGGAFNVLLPADSGKMIMIPHQQNNNNVSCQMGVQSAIVGNLSQIPMLTKSGYTMLDVYFFCEALLKQGLKFWFSKRKKELENSNDNSNDKQSNNNLNDNNLNSNNNSNIKNSNIKNNLNDNNSNIKNSNIKNNLNNNNSNTVNLSFQKKFQLSRPLS